MKINKVNNLVEELVEAPATQPLTEDAPIDDIASASVQDIAVAVKDAAEEASDGEETFSDANAEKVAQEIKTYAKGFDAAAWAPVDVKNDLTEALDDCLANALLYNEEGNSDGVDLLVTGLPGSGKTGITKAWANARGVKLFYLNAKNDDLGAILNGFPVDEVEENDGKRAHGVVRSYSKTLDMLDRDRSVLFLDEFNRAPEKLRAVLFSLINEHVVDGPGEDGYRHFDKLLFTVACINPSVPTDPGAMDLNDAEKSRFVNKIDWDSEPGRAADYIIYHINKLKNAVKQDDPNYAYKYTRYAKTIALAKTLLNDITFEFDSREDLTDLFNENATILSQRSITDGIMAHGYSKEKFLRWVDKSSGFLEKDKEMIHKILDSYIEPTNIKVPGAGEADDDGSNAPAEDPTAKKPTNGDSGDFDDVFGSDGDETDTDLFGNTGVDPDAAKKVRISATDALNKIKGFDFNA